MELNIVTMKYTLLKTTPAYRQKGLTLIELMVTTVILAVVTSAAVPAMKDLFERKSVFAIGDIFIKSIKLARVEAIQRGKTIRVKTTTGTGDWSQGWSIEFTDDNNIIQTVRSFPPLPSNPNFTSNEYDGSPDLTILPTGQVSSIGTFDLFYPTCVGNQRLGFNVLLSGLIQRGLTACP